MAVLDRDAGEVLIKLLYFGPSLGGKTESLRFLRASAPAATRTEVCMLSTETERLVYFSAGTDPARALFGHPARLYLCAFPGQFLPPSCLAPLIRGSDGLVFVADSQHERREANVDSLARLDDTLAELGLDPRAVPRVLQYNKRDLANAAPLDALEAELNAHGARSFATVATTGVGVREAFDAIASATLERVAQAGAAALAPVTSGFMPDSVYEAIRDETRRARRPSASVIRIRDWLSRRR